MDKEFRTSINVNKSPRIASDDNAYNGDLSHQVSKFYDLMRGEGHWYEKIERMKLLIGELSGKNVLDLGTQVGTYALYSSKESKLSAGVDFSYAALKKAVELREQLYSSNIYFVQANVNSLPFADKTFDVVIGCDIVEHLVDADLEYMLKESYRVMKNEGILVLQTYPNRYFYCFGNFNKFSVIPIVLFWLPKKLYAKTIDIYHRIVAFIKNLKWKFAWSFPKTGHINCQTLESISEFVTYAGFRIDKAFAENTYSKYERSEFRKLMEKLLRNNVVTKQNIYLKPRKIS